MRIQNQDIFIDAYRYGFNGMEKDDEIKGAGNSYTTEFRQYDTRLGRWLSLDPVVHAGMSPYNAFDNNPIYYIDPKGSNSGWFVNDSTGSVLHVPGVDNLEGVKIEGVNNMEYSLFATDQEMENARIDADASAGIPGNDYENKVYAKEDADGLFEDLGVSLSFQLATVQTYTFSILQQTDYEFSGRRETAGNKKFQIVETMYTIHGCQHNKAAIETMNYFNKENKEIYNSYKKGFMYRVDYYKGKYLSLAPNGTVQNVPLPYSRGGNGEGTTLGLATALSGWLFETIIRL